VEEATVGSVLVRFKNGAYYYSMLLLVLSPRHCELF